MFQRSSNWLWTSLSLPPPPPSLEGLMGNAVSHFVGYLFPSLESRRVPYLITTDLYVMVPTKLCAVWGCVDHSKANGADALDQLPALSSLWFPSSTIYIPVSRNPNAPLNAPPTSWAAWRRGEQVYFKPQGTQCTRFRESIFPQSHFFFQNLDSSQSQTVQHLFL